MEKDLSPKLLSQSELTFLGEAKQFLERESFLLKAANIVGKPIEGLVKVLPKKAEKVIEDAVHKSLSTALKVALKSTPELKSEKDWQDSLDNAKTSRFMHGGLTAFTGALGGAFGLPGMVVELPVTTTLIMRSITNIAYSFNFAKEDTDLPLQCLAVFTLGSKQKKSDDQLDATYYTSRLLLAESMQASATFVAKNSSKFLIESLQKGSAPVLLNFINRVAGFFNVVVTQKMLAGAVPLVGGIGAASINVAFTDYYSQAAKYHFGILALEKKYGKNLIKSIYESLKEG